MSVYIFQRVRKDSAGVDKNRKSLYNFTKLYK